MFQIPNFDTIQDSLESSTPYPMFYLRHGVRRAVQLVAPPLSKLNTLELPRGSILHYLADDESQYGINQDDPVLQGQTRLIMVDHITKLGDTKGSPRPMQVVPSTLIREYHRKYRNTRNLLRPELALSDPRTLIVEDYSLLPHLYRYTASFYTSYYKWWNVQAAIWKKVAEISQNTNREQFMVCNLPDILPPPSLLRVAEQTMSRMVLTKLRDQKSWFILELWKWLGVHRQESVLANASPEALAKMNLIWIESGRWTVVNLGQLNNWRKPGKLELEAGVADEGILTTTTIQKRFLRMLMVVGEVKYAPQSPVTSLDDAAENEETPVVGSKANQGDTKPEAQTQAKQTKPEPRYHRSINRYQSK